MTGLLALIDDIAFVMKKVALQADDVAVLTKTATQKTAGILGDDLAVNAEQLSGLQNDEELGVILKVFLGALLNKAIIVPFALALTFYLPAVFKWVLILGGAYLCFEGAEKLLHKLPIFRSENHPANHKEFAASKEQRIKNAIKTDFILSIEIVAILLATLNEQTDLEFSKLVAALVVSSLLVCIIIYGCVAFVLKIDDFGLYLLKKGTASVKKMGKLLLAFAPRLMSFVSWTGTIAMFAVGGELMVHKLHIELPFEQLAFVQIILFGLIMGFFLVGLFQTVKRFKTESP